MKGNLLLNSCGLLGIFIVTLFFFITSTNAQSLENVKSSSPETVSVSSPTLAKGVMHGEDIYVAKNGAIFKKGDEIQLSVGTKEGSGIFKSIPALNMSNKPFPLGSLKATYAGQKVEIKAIKQFRIDGKNSALITYALIDVGSTLDYAINIEYALLIKEIIVE